MKLIRFAFAALLLVPLLVACSPDEDPATIVVDSRSEAASPSPEPATPELTRPEVSQGQLEVSQGTIDGSVAGEITLVDELVGTFVLNDPAGAEWQFRYGPDTEITGSGGAQGLTGQTGNLVVVHYLGSDPASREAVLVEIGSTNN